MNSLKLFVSTVHDIQRAACLLWAVVFEHIFRVVWARISLGKGSIFSV